MAMGYCSRRPGSRSAHPQHLVTRSRSLLLGIRDLGSTRNHVHRSKVKAAYAHHRPSSDNLRAGHKTRGRTYSIGLLSLPNATQARKYAGGMGGLGYRKGRWHVGTVWQSTREYMEGLCLFSGRLRIYASLMMA